MTDDQILSIYKAGAGSSTAAGLRAVFDAGRDEMKKEMEAQFTKVEPKPDFKVEVDYSKKEDDPEPVRPKPVSMPPVPKVQADLKKRPTRR